MSLPHPDAAGSEQENSWENITSCRPEVPHAAPRWTGWKRAISLLPGFVLLLFLAGLAWAGWQWRARHAERELPMAVGETIVTADEGCQKVTRIIRELPQTEDGIKTATLQIETELQRIKARTEQIRRDERVRLQLEYSDFKRARVGLASKVEPFVKRNVVKGAVDVGTPSASLADLERAAKGTEYTLGPGKDLLDAVERYDAACQALLVGLESGNNGATWSGGTRGK
jgi:hypothetical protein